ncbi:hypothetical protein MMC13_004409 [Lambiella insularis]|nr:hypothetical protein [Lambiella insularis]
MSQQFNSSGARGYIDPNIPNPRGPGDADFIIYGYVPSLALAILAITIFALSLVAHLTQLFRYRTWYFTAVSIGCLFEVIGYIGRALSSHVDPYSYVFFVVQYFFIVVAPVLLSISIYQILSILIGHFGQETSPLPKTWVLTIFITSDVIATVTQIVGASLIGVAESRRKDPQVPNDVLLAGLAFQVFTFLIFLILFATFLWRAKKMLSKRSDMRVFLIVVVVATLLVYLRTCFRLAETSQNTFGYLSSHEAFFGCLEFAPVVAALLLFNVWHPGRYLPKGNQTIRVTDV